jgi:hypothetical protein
VPTTLGRRSVRGTGPDPATEHPVPASQAGGVALASDFLPPSPVFPGGCGCSTRPPPRSSCRRGSPSARSSTSRRGSAAAHTRGRSRGVAVLAASNGTWPSQGPSGKMERGVFRRLL